MGTINTNSAPKKNPTQGRRIRSPGCKKDELEKKSTTVQTLIFDKAVFDRSESIQWARTHGFKSNKVDTTSSSYRLRQRNPGDFARGSFKTISLRRGVKAVIGTLKADKQKVSKDFWTL